MFINDIALDYITCIYGDKQNGMLLIIFSLGLASKIIAIMHTVSLHPVHAYTHTSGNGGKGP